MSGVEGRPPARRPPGRALADLDPGYFALVMATGIVSVGTDLLGEAVLSRVILGAAIAGFVLLALAYVSRAVLYRPEFRRSLQDPGTAMGYFTVVAGTDVLAIRLDMAGHTLVAFGLGAAAGLLWIVLTYALPWSIVAGAHRPVLGELNGTWLIWVVSTQSLAIVAAAVAPDAPAAALRAELPVVAMCLWGLGVMLYVILIVLIFQRLLLVAVTPAEMGPAYWIAMGATAISVRAAAGLLALHDPASSLPLQEMRPFVVGLSVVLWAFGTWWIPLLVLFGIWRYLLRGYSRRYEPRLWSAVFPLGMYTVASETLGKAAHMGFLETVARGWVWVGVGAWVAVLATMLGAFVSAGRGRQQVPEGAITRQR